MGTILKILAFILIGLAVAAAGAFAYHGGFSSVKVEKSVFGPAEIVYATHRGPYEKIGKTWETFKAAYSAAGLEECDGLALYFDPPTEPKETLRSVIACRIDGLDESRRAALKAVLPNAVIPYSDGFGARFPYRTYASYFIAPMKVYPAFTKVTGGQEPAQDVEPGPAIEIYGVEGRASEIQFHIPASHGREAYSDILAAFGE